MRATTDAVGSMLGDSAARGVEPLQAVVVSMAINTTARDRESSLPARPHRPPPSKYVPSERTHGSCREHAECPILLSTRDVTVIGRAPITVGSDGANFPGGRRRRADGRCRASSPAVANRPRPPSISVHIGQPRLSSPSGELRLGVVLIAAAGAAIARTFSATFAAWPLRHRLGLDDARRGPCSARRSR